MTFGEVSPSQLLARLHKPVKHMADEATEVEIAADGISIQAGSERGLWYGLLTLRQLLEQSRGNIPTGRISDEPDFQDRGVMLDVSRCKVPKLSTLFDLIDRLAGLKYNQLQLYTEHTFAFIHHPLVWSQSSPYTAADVEKIRRYCEARYIHLVPNLNSFGHMERWLKHPEYHGLAECPNGFVHPLSGQTMRFGSTLKPNRQSLRFLDALYAEYLPLFDSSCDSSCDSSDNSPHFNIGGDEPWELGQGWSRKQCESRGKSRVYLDFIAEIQRLVEKHGRRMQFWGDIVLTEPSCLNRVSTDTIALNWGYEASHPFNRECRSLNEAGIAYYVVPGTSSWNSLTGRTRNCEENLDNAAKNGIKYGARGYLVTDWGDHGHHQYQGVSYLGYFLGACHAWHHKSVKKVNTVQGLNQCFFDDTSGVAGRLYYELGKVMELAPVPITNATLFNQLLFRREADLADIIEPVSDAQLDDCLGRFQDIRSEISQMDRQTADRALHQQELDNAISMAEAGIERARLRVRHTGNTTAALRQSLRSLIGQHENLWLARNRPGGLAESRDYLSRTLTSLD